MPEIRDRITELRRVKASDLLANPRNWRKHPSSQASALSAVLQEVGYADALLARETPEGLQLIDGHLRQKLTPDQDVPVLVLDVTEDEANKILLTLDPLAALAESDKQALDGLLRDVTTGDAALQEMLSELAKDNGLTYGTQEPATAPEPEIDRAEELQKKWKTELGQLWQIGNHRLLCGDSTKAEDVTRLIGGREITVLLTDPPYSSGGFQEAGKSSGSIGTRGSETIALDNLSTRGYRLLMQDVLSVCGADLLYVFTDWRMWMETYDAAERGGWRVRNMLVWDKQQMGMGMPWRNQHELILFGKRTPGHLRDGQCGNVLQAKRSGNKNHPTEKPAALLVALFANSDDGAVYDPFLGSGTTMVAAEQSNRACFGMELSPAFVAVTLERLFQMGLQPMPADRVKQQTYIVHSSVVPASSVV